MYVHTFQKMTRMGIRGTIIRRGEGDEGERQGVALLIMLVKTLLSLFWESNSKTDFIEVRRGGVLTKFLKFLDLKVSTGRWMGLHLFIYSENAHQVSKLSK